MQRISIKPQWVGIHSKVACLMSCQCIIEILGPDVLIFFIVPQRLTLVSIAKRKISKSNKSELWNRLSYRGLSYFFEVGSETFRNYCKISSKHFENRLKSFRIFQILMGGMNFREKLQKTQTSSAGRSVLFLNWSSNKATKSISSF